MPKIINPRWKEEMIDKINTAEVFDETISYNPAIQWLIEYFTRKGKIYKIYNIGAGVKRITLNTDSCPCCKRSFKKD